MKLSMAFATTIAVFALGCEKNEKTEEPQPPRITAAATTAVPVPAEKPADNNASPTPAAAGAAGPALSVAQLEEAKKSVHGGQSFKEAGPLLTVKLGKPHGKIGDNKIFWRAVEGDKCARLEVQKNGEAVGTVSLTSVDKLMKSQFDACMQ